MSFAVNLLLLAVLIALSAFFSSSETAFMSLSKLKVKQLVKEKDKRAPLISALKANTESLLTTILVGNNLVNNFASSIAAALAISLVGESGIGIATAVMTVFIIIFGEIVPKTIASHRPIETAQRFAPLLRTVQVILHPVAALFTLVSRFASRVASGEKQPIVTEEELKTLIDVGSQEGTLESGEKDMMHKIFEFTDLHVRSIMTHKARIKAVPIDAPYKTVVEAFKACGFSHLAVYRDNIDGICGVVHYRDVLFCKNKGADFALTSCMSEPLFVPESKSAVAMLELFRAEHKHFAVAVDEYGCNSGVITMDDLLSAVFGRLSDDSTAAAPPAEERIEFVNATEFRIPADMTLSDFNGVFGFALESEFYQTLGGWLLERFGALPAVGAAVRFDGATFVVEELFPRCIKKVRLKMPLRMPAPHLPGRER